MAREAYQEFRNCCIQLSNSSSCRSEGITSWLEFVNGTSESSNRSDPGTSDIEDYHADVIEHGVCRLAARAAAALTRSRAAGGVRRR